MISEGTASRCPQCGGIRQGSLGRQIQSRGRSSGGVAAGADLADHLQDERDFSLVEDPLDHGPAAPHDTAKTTTTFTPPSLPPNEDRLPPAATVTSPVVPPANPAGDGGSAVPPNDHQLRQMWRKAAKCDVAPMATIKGEVADGPLASGLVLHRRSLVAEDHPKAADADYCLLRLIGQGGMGAVFAAQQTAVQREVAVKTLRQQIASNQADRQKFLKEAIITAELDHPNIMPIHDLGIGDDGTIFYSMQFIRGETWQTVMEKRTRSENLEILLRVCDAVSYAHSRDIIHRDVKPDNVMLGKFGEVLLTDWGLAINLQSKEPFALGGSPAYMAPEMALHQVQRIGKASDIYLLGASLYQIVTGYPPHPGETATECIAAAAANQIIPQSRHDELLSIALKAMETSPADRFQTVGQFQNAVRDHLAHQESMSLTQGATADLQLAQSEGLYEAYARAMFSLQEALKLWPDNEVARDRLQTTRLAYATAALKREDYDLGLSLLDGSNPAEADLSQQLRQGAKQRATRLQRLRIARRSAATFLVIALVIAIGGVVVLIRENQEKEIAITTAIGEAERADIATREAKEIASVSQLTAEGERRARLESDSSRLQLRLDSIRQRWEIHQATVARLLAERRAIELSLEAGRTLLASVVQQQGETTAETPAASEASPSRRAMGEDISRAIERLENDLARHFELQQQAEPNGQALASDLLLKIDQLQVDLGQLRSLLHDAESRLTERIPSLDTIDLDADELRAQIEQSAGRSPEQPTQLTETADTLAEELRATIEALRRQRDGS